MAQALKRDEPFTGEVIRLYETDKNRPGKDARLALALVFERTESFIEFGELSPTSSAQVREPDAQYATGKKVDRLIKAFTWLTDDEQETLLKELEAKATANKAIARQLGPRFKIASDATMLDLLKKGGDFPPGTKRRPAPKPRRAQLPDDPDPE